MPELCSNCGTKMVCVEKGVYRCDKCWPKKETNIEISVGGKKAADLTFKQMEELPGRIESGEFDHIIKKERGERSMDIELEVIEIDTKEKSDGSSVTYKLAQKVGKDEKPDFKMTTDETTAKAWNLEMVGDVITFTVGKVEKQTTLDES